MTRSKQSGAVRPPQRPGLSRLRDDLARHFEPHGSYEATLVDVAAQALERLQAAYEDERKYRSEHDMVETITTNLKEYQAVTRNVSQCERAWRKSVQMIEDEQRRRKSESAESPNARAVDERSRPAAWPPAPMVTSSTQNPGQQQVRAALRE